MKHISAFDCKRLADQQIITLIDVREPWEIEICSIQGSLKIPMHTINDEALSLDTRNAYVIVCKTGKRAEAVANLLERDFSFENIQILDGGITEWYKSFEPSFELY